MSQQRATSGSSTWIGWKRRVSAGSFSIYWRYSDQVVAAMVRSVPRASAGFSRLAASPVPAEPPAPISVCASSMKRMIGVGEFCTSSMTERSRCSNSPFIEAPACIRPMSSAQSLTPRSGGGTSPAAMRCAKPSTTAVLPTPASPVRIGLFCRRRISTSMIWRISSSRPRTGSISPAFALAVRSCEKRSSAVVPLAPIASCSAPGVPAARSPEPSIGRRFSSSEPAQIVRYSFASASTLILANSLEAFDERAAQLQRLQGADQHVPGADLRLAEEQRRVVPAAVEQVDDGVGDAGHLGLVLAEAVDDRADVGRAAWRGRA